MGCSVTETEPVQLATSAGLPCYYPRMPDQIIDAAMARSLHVIACRAHPMVGWVIVTDPPHYPCKFVARFGYRCPLLLRTGCEHPGRDPRRPAARSGAHGPPAG